MLRGCCDVAVEGCASSVGAARGIVVVRLGTEVGGGERVLVRGVVVVSEMPVVAVFGAPGHGKSSVANMILGEERFQVRGRNVLVEDRIQV